MNIFSKPLPCMRLKYQDRCFLVVGPMLSHTIIEHDLLPHFRVSKGRRHKITSNAMQGPVTSCARKIKGGRKSSAAGQTGNPEGELLK